MLTKRLLSFVFVSSLLFCTKAYSQDVIADLQGSWEYRKESMHVDFVKAENHSALNPVYEAKITRADWSPERKGRTRYVGVVQTAEKKWRGFEIDDKGKQRKVRFSLKRDGKLHTTSYLRGVKKIQWTLNQQYTEKNEVAQTGS